ncbi:transcriptional regulator [Tetragenococcus osmophilus]|uniref:Transcriptional regulator n=3 Tax=Tetragenococcus osmophilus TaxID=526944 RepID=A0AA37XN44_9ENTE|nr:sugar-binding transcriptional regulator [Tetragenococcus osmophilus]AYW47193.1 transcriptional regulator [Tetragenococcus osmophilus]GMA52699.1 DeoR family transcriptional regulator [Alicyclobacillus contaminans]GMA55283.1 DeoR family transcriptional regulator [Alicyclobacillus contaminans]GMA73290.1 DeoR family transcriptional regulator [Tetragenococcus osmophilus]
MNQSEEKELVRVSSMYYEEGMTQAEIARNMGVSRSLISKMLIDAKEAGVVEIFINSKSSYSIRLERELELQYDLKRVLVVDTLDLEANEVKKMAAREAALWLQKMIKGNKKLGISWGESLRELVNRYPFEKQSDVTIFPLIGGMGDEYIDIHSNQLCYDLARKLRGKTRYLYAPALISNTNLRKELANNPTIYNVMEESKSVDIALVGISDPRNNSTMEKIGYINQKDIVDLEKNKVVGDINSRFFDKNGEEADIDINQHVMGISLEDIKKIPTVMSIAFENSKIDAVEVAVKHKLFNVLVTTDEIAKRLLEK